MASRKRQKQTQPQSTIAGIATFSTMTFGIMTDNNILHYKWQVAYDRSKPNLEGTIAGIATISIMTLDIMTFRQQYSAL
jgi:hypothetical protein